VEHTARKLGGVIGLIGALVGAAAVEAQEATPNIGLTLTETLNKLAPAASAKDDLREIPKPKNDKLSDTVRVTVSVGDGQCLPGEDNMMIPRSGRRIRTR
jgi:hypothetical protein